MLNKDGSGDEEGTRPVVVEIGTGKVVGNV